MKQNIIMAVLRKANSHSIVICSLIKKNGLFQKKTKQGGRTEDMEFPGVLKKEHVEN